VFNVTTDIKPVHPKVPWTYGNTYGARGDRFYAVRHVLDTYCDNFGRFIVTRTNNRDVAASPYVLTQFYWDVPDTLAKAGLAHTTPVYFFIDTNMEGALAHWLGESAAFLPLWAAVKDLPHGAQGRTRLMHAAWTGNLARVQWLLSRGAPLSAQKRVRCSRTVRSGHSTSCCGHTPSCE
jgi:hypothetical protein